MLWLRLWSWLPVATPAHAAAIATAVLAALALVALHAACRAWGARPLAATIAVAVFGAAPVVQRYACEAEVFALNDLCVALVLWLAAAAGPVRGGWRGAALGLVAGAGLANHLTCALIAPVGVLGVVRAVRESPRAALPAAAAGLALGLLPYAYLAIADGPAAWGRVASLSDLLAFVQRSDYGGATGFAAGGIDVAWSTSFAALARTLGQSWLWLLAAAGAAMLAVRIWRPAGESRWAWALLAASTALAGPVLVSRFNIDPHGMGAYVCERFHILPALLLAVPVAAALDLDVARFARAARIARVAATVPPRRAAWFATIGFVGLTAAGLPAILRIHSPATELGVDNLLRSLPPGAIAVVTGDDHCAGARYLQLVRGERPDVAVVCAGLLPLAWYRAVWADRGLALPASSGPRLGEAVLRTGRPAFVDPRLTGVAAALPGYPFGVLRRVLPPTAAPPPAAEIAAQNREIYRAFDLDYPRPGPDDGYPTAVHHRYADAWVAIAGLLAATGDRDAARDALALARSLLPTPD